MECLFCEKIRKKRRKSTFSHFTKKNGGFI